MNNFGYSWYQAQACKGEKKHPSVSSLQILHSLCVSVCVYFLNVSILKQVISKSDILRQNEVKFNYLGEKEISQLQALRARRPAALMLLFTSQFEGMEVLLGSLVFSSRTGQAVNDSDVKVTCPTLLNMEMPQMHGRRRVQNVSLWLYKCLLRYIEMKSGDRCSIYFASLLSV